MSSGPSSTPSDIERFKDVTDSDYTEAVGRAIMTFSNLENILGTAVAALVSADENIGRAVATPLSFKFRLKVFDALLRARTNDETILAVHEKLVADLSALEEKRNGIVHAAWATRKDDKVRRRFRHRVVFKRKVGMHLIMDQVHPDDLHEIADQFSAAFDRVCLFVVELTTNGLAFKNGIRADTR